jgi:hypothetical protein
MIYSRNSLSDGNKSFTIGLLGAPVNDPTLLVDPSFLQPGITFSRRNT